MGAITDAPEVQFGGADLLTQDLEIGRALHGGVYGQVDALALPPSVAVAGRLVQVGFECVSRKYLALECGQRWLAVRVDGGCARTPLIQCDDIGDLAQGHEQLEPRPLGRARSEEHTSELQSL